LLVNIHVNKPAVRTFAAVSLLIGASLVACSSSTEEPGNPIIPPVGGSAGTPAQGGSGTAGAAAGSSAGGMSGGSTGGESNAGTAGAGGGNGCIGNQIKDMATGMCACPTYAPNFCTDVMKCVSQAKDPTHCGDCDTKCPATSACSESKCTTEPMSLGEVAGCGSLKLQQADGKLYLLSTMTGALQSMPIPAGAAPTSVATGLTMGSAFALDATNAYVATGMTLQRVKLSDGTKQTVVTETTPIFDVAVAGGKLYYAVGKDVKSVDATATAGTGTSVAVGIDEGEPQGVAVSGDYVLYGSAQAFNVEADPIAPGEGHLKLGASQGGLIFGHRSIQADAMYAYWAVNGTVQRAPFTGADHAQKTAGTGLGNITAYAINATTAYFGSDTGDLEKAAFGAEKSIWMARGLGKLSSIVLDATSVYAATDQCKILKTAL
jgi:hypothetical protein